MNPIKNHNYIVNFLLQGIIDGSLKPGKRLVERKLASDLGVSRTPVREAIRKLEQMHLVNFTPYKGVFVRQLSELEADEIFEIRIVLESLAAKLCATHASLKEIKKLESALEYFKEIVLDSNQTEHTIKNYFIANNQFHEIIVSSTHNSMLVNMLSTFQAHVSLIRHISLPQRTLQSLEEHTAILEAIKERNPEKASQMAYMHIERTWQFVQNSINHSSNIRSL